MSLKNVYAPYFDIGVSVAADAFESQAALRELPVQYDSMTCENEMKPMYILDEVKNMQESEKYAAAPAVCFDRIRKYLEFARDNGMRMRGHTLVWHNQTPRWFFSRDYRKESDAPLADRETMLARMENYIKSVLTYVQREYPGIIYAWDVVNEAIEDGGIRRSWWTQTVGEDYFLHAFRFARKYADPDVSLFYNDYDTYNALKREKIFELILSPLIKESLVDGMGMQSHLTMARPDLSEYDVSLRYFGKTGLQIQVTELDIHNPDSGKDVMRAQAQRYRELFTLLVKAKKEGVANLTNITFWNMQDEESWLTCFHGCKSYPLLFTNGYRPKTAYWAVLSVPAAVEGDAADRLPGGERFEFWEKETAYTREYHVNPGVEGASDTNDGSMEHPFATIQAAADRAEPGTRVLIHSGVYREWVRPRRGGDGPDKMVSYEAYGDGEVIIKASEIATDFRVSEGWNLCRQDQKSVPDTLRIWKVRLDPDKFRGYNPFCAVNIIHDRLFIEYDKTDMTTYLNRRGMVFCDGKPLEQVPLYYQLASVPGSYWVEANGQTIHFRLADDSDPADHVIELTCREQCFAPEEPFLSYIKIKGLTCAHAATGGPVPQRGAVSCFRGHHWVIEDCIIDWSNCVGIDVGNECWHHTYQEGQIIGHTVVRGCEIRDVGVCGIAGLFATNLLIEDNLITGTGWQKMELSWEAGGIKIHNGIDCMIRRNVFSKTLRADHLWMDVGNENNRITGNLFLDGIQQREAIFIECSRDGVNLIDNNIFWNVEGRFDLEKIPVEPGSSGWYKNVEYDVVNGYAVYGEGTDRLQIVNNLIGKCRSAGYFAKTVSFRIPGNKRGGTSREAAVYNNIFYDCKEAAIKFPTRENESQGNVFANMPGGYLRIMYPLPENCLDLSAWQEFYGFDQKGQEAWLDIDVDTDELTLVVKTANDDSWISPHGTGRYQYFKNPAQMETVEAYPGLCSDFWGNSVNGKRIPGPLQELEEGQKYRIDPRHKNR